MFVGLPDSGKTTILCSCDGCLLINCDGIPLPVRDPNQMKAATFPHIGSNGEHLGWDGTTPINFNWEAIVGVVTELERRVDRNLPRPDLVAVDSITSLLEHAKDFVVRKAGKTDWRELHGPSAYDDAYNLVTRLATHVHSMGYGFFYTGHLVNEVIQLGDDRHKERVSLTLTPGFWKRLFWKLEMCLSLTPRYIPVVVPRDQRQPGQPSTRSERCICVTTRDEATAGITKCKCELPDIVLPLSGGWNVFENAYTEACSPPDPNTIPVP
jgi:hypothetical protein